MNQHPLSMQQQLIADLDANGALSIHDVTPSIMVDLFINFDVPESLRHIVYVAERIEAVLTFYRAAVNDKGTITNWLSCCRALIACEDRLTTLGIATRPDAGPRCAHTLGECKRHPGYAAFWYTNAVDTLAQPYLHLCAILHVAWPALTAETTIHFRRGVALAVRDLGSSHGTAALELVSAVPLSLANFTSHLAEIIDSEKMRFLPIRKRMKIILRACRIALQQEEFHHRAHGGRGNQHGGSPWLGVPPSERFLTANRNSDSLSNAQFSHFTTGALSAGRRHRRELDVTIDDYPTDVEAASFYDDLARPIETDNTLLALAARGAQHSITKSSQELAVDPSVLTPFEAAVMLQEMDAAFQRTPPPNDESLVACLFIGFCFYLGRSQDEIIQMEIVRKTKTENSSNHILIQLDNRAVDLPIKFDALKCALTPTQKSQAVPVSEHIVIPLATIMAESCLHLYSRFGGSRRWEIFQHFPNTLAAAKRIVTDTSIRRNINVTLDKIAKTTHTRIASAAADSVTASHITGRVYSSVNSQLHYATNTATVVESKYCTAINHMVDDAALELGASFDSAPWRINTRGMATTHIGARMTPQRNTVQGLVRILQSSAGIRPAANTRAGLVPFHNMFVAYTVLLLDFATAHRNVDFRYFARSFLDLDAMLMLITDKDSPSYHNARAVPLTSISVKQLRCYLTHLDALLPLLATLNLASVRALSESTDPPLLKNRHRLHDWAEQAVGIFFFLDEDGSIVPFSTHRLRDFVGDAFALRIHCCRHYLRSELADLGINGEMLDAFLGHWTFGTNPYGDMSTLPPCDVFFHLLPAIKCIQERDGWIAIRGLHDKL